MNCKYKPIVSLGQSVGNMKNNALTLLEAANQSQHI